MAGKGDERAEGLAEQSLNTSIVHPAEGNAVHRNPSSGDRTLTENDQRKGLERTEPADPQSDDGTKP
jgi:hypothetical protein